MKEFVQKLIVASVSTNQIIRRLTSLCSTKPYRIKKKLLLFWVNALYNMQNTSTNFISIFSFRFLSVIKRVGRVNVFIVSIKSMSIVHKISIWRLKYAFLSLFSSFIYLNCWIFDVMKRTMSVLSIESKLRCDKYLEKPLNYTVHVYCLRHSGNFIHV